MAQLTGQIMLTSAARVCHAFFQAVASSHQLSRREKPRCTLFTRVVAPSAASGSYIQPSILRWHPVDPGPDEVSAFAVCASLALSQSAPTHSANASVFLNLKHHFEHMAVLQVVFQVCCVPSHSHPLSCQSAWPKNACFSVLVYTKTLF